MFSSRIKQVRVIRYPHGLSLIHYSRLYVFSCTFSNGVFTGWWLVENEAKCLAWFPAPYLENAEADDEGADQELGESKNSDRKITLRLVLLVKPFTTGL